MTYSPCLGNVISGELWPERAAIEEAQASLQAKYIIVELESDTTGLGIKEHACFSAQE